MSAEGDGGSWLDVDNWDPDAPGLDAEDWDPGAARLDNEDGCSSSRRPDDLGSSPGGRGFGRKAAETVPEVWDAGFLPRDGAPPALAGLAAGPAGGFAAGNELDVLLPGVALAGFADDVTGPDGRCAAASDDQLIGVLRAWDRLESWTATRKLTVIARADVRL